MKRLMMIFCLLHLPLIAGAVSYVSSIEVIPPHPDPLEPVSIHVSGGMPSSCWSLGGQNGTSFSLIDVSSPEVNCLAVIIPFDLTFDLGGLPEGVHTITVNEWHQSLYDPGLWSIPVTFTVGTPPVEDESASWSAVKSLYR